MIFELAHHMALLPAATLAVRRSRNGALWWLAGVFLVAWLADWGKHLGINPLLVSWVYPISQAGIVLAVFLPRRIAFSGLVAVTILGILALLWQGDRGPDLLLRAGAWGAIIATVAPRRDLGLLRISLLIYFGLGLAAWAGYTGAPGWTSWRIYQVVRLAGIILFCSVVLRKEMAWNSSTPH